MTSFSISQRLPLAALALTAGLLSSCEPKLDEAAPTASRGSADFTRYIAVGNSLTAGFEDNGLYREGQLNSYPSMLAQQFALVGGGPFVQPLFTEAQANGTGFLKLTGFTATGSPITGSETTKLAVRASRLTDPANPYSERLYYTKYVDPINNLGVPGLRMSEIEAPTLGDGRNTNNSGPFNALFERLTPDATPTQTYLQRVAASNPTFFTCWLGNNDVLGFATSGGALAELSSASYGFTSLATFTEKAGKLIDALTTGTAKGVVGNIPDVTAIPFFNTVGPPTKALLVSKGVTQMVATTGSFNLLDAPARKTIATADIKDATGGKQLFTLTASPYVALIGQPGGKYWRDFDKQLRPALGNSFDLSGKLSLWHIDTTKAFGTTTENPWPSTLLLDDAEQARVKQTTTDFNAALKAKADAKNLPYFDANGFFNGIAANGLATNGVSNSPAYISGNLFSLDGVHPSPRGYSVVANELIRIINQTYGASIPPVNPNTYRGARYN